MEKVTHKEVNYRSFGLKNKGYKHRSELRNFWAKNDGEKDTNIGDNCKMIGLKIMRKMVKKSG